MNKARLVTSIAELVNDGKLEGISDLRDESGRDDEVRIVIELKSGARPHTVLNNLYKHTALQSTFGALMLSLVDGRPQILGLKPMLENFLDYRRFIIRKRTEFELRKAKERAHILEGLRICLGHLDQVIAIIRGASDEAAAQRELESTLQLSEKQSKAIVDLRLGRLTRLEAGKIQEEYEGLLQEIALKEDILANAHRVNGIIKEELADISRKFGSERRTEIRSGDVELQDEDLIPREQVFVTLTLCCWRRQKQSPS